MLPPSEIVVLAMDGCVLCKNFGVVVGARHVAVERVAVVGAAQDEKLAVRGLGHQGQGTGTGIRRTLQKSLRRGQHLARYAARQAAQAEQAAAEQKVVKPASSAPKGSRGKVLHV